MKKKSRLIVSKVSVYNSIDLRFKKTMIACIHWNDLSCQTPNIVYHPKGNGLLMSIIFNISHAKKFHVKVF